ncbi:MAG: MFS transporter [Chitinophagaceae bacterium]|nr:MFS transporter [Chitinophagaceae bacterium]
MDHSSAIALLRTLRNQEFSLFISARFILISALFIQSTALSYQMYQLTGNPLSLGLIGLSELIPALGLSVFAGYLADQLEKRTLFLGCVLAYVACAGITYWIISPNFIEQFGQKACEWSMYGSMFMNGMIRAFIAPASFSLLPMLIPRQEIPRAITWSSTAWLLGSVIGPLVSGLIIAYVNSSNAILWAMILFVLTAFLTSRIQKKPFERKKDDTVLKGISEGFRFIFKNKIILAVLSLDLFAVLFGGAETLLPVFSKEILNCGPTGFGWLRSAHGLGSVFLLFVLAYLPLKTNVGNKLLFSVAGFGLCIILFGLSRNFYFSFLCLFVAGLFDGVSVVIRHSILQLKTPEDIKGRVSSVNMMFISSSNELGAFESGLAARLLGTVPSVVFGGIMTVVIAILTFVGIPALRKVRLEAIKE